MEERDQRTDTIFTLFVHFMHIMKIENYKDTREIAVERRTHFLIIRVPTSYMALNLVNTWVLLLIRILRCRIVAILPLMFRNSPQFLQHPSGYYLKQDRFLQCLF